MELGNIEGEIPVFGEGNIRMRSYEESGFLGMKP